MALVAPVFLTEAQQLVDTVPRVVSSLQARLRDLGGDPGAPIQLQDALQALLDRPLRLLGPLASIGLGIAGVLATLVLVLLAAYYVAVNPAPLRDGLLALFPPGRREAVRAVLAEVRAAWTGWLRGVLVDMLVTGVLLYVGLRAVGLQYAIVFSVLTALLVVVPYLGAVAGGVPPVLLALADSPARAAIVLGVYLVVQQIEGNVIVPLVMARAVRLHPAIILIGVVMVGSLVGFVGLLVAVPLVSATLIVVRHAWVDPLQRREAGGAPS